MIVTIEALNYRCLRYIRQRVDRFLILVGPNASGKSTFLDVVGFLGDLLNGGPEFAVHERASSLEELVWNRTGTRFQLAVEMTIPEDLRRAESSFVACRYETIIGTDAKSGEIRVLAESFWLLPVIRFPRPAQRTLFPEEPQPPKNTVASKKNGGWRRVVSKIEESGNDYFRSESTAWNTQFRLGPFKSALANLPEDETKFPVAIWAKRLLMDGIQNLALNSKAMRAPSPAGLGFVFRPDGANLPAVIRQLQRQQPKRYDAWLDHVRLALPELKSISVRRRPEDKSLYLRFTSVRGLRFSSWLASDGTLRLLALTILAYLPDKDQIYLVEEPENGIHPQALHAVFDSLSSAYDAQVLVASHSPVFLRLAKPDQVLCFSRTESGATDVILGSEHPRLRDWREETTLTDLFAAGVLG